MAGMEERILSMGDFLVQDESIACPCPSTPGGMSVEDFVEAPPLTKTFCSQISVGDYEKEGTTETEKALNVSLDH
jgi:hypothetical protein